MRSFYRFKRLSTYAPIVHQVSQKDQASAYLGSLALHTDENPNEILQNRQQIQAQYPQMKFVVAHQTHSANIQVIERAESIGWETQETAIADCDALLSNQEGVMLTILTADCVPILLFDPTQKVVGAVHAGWNGTKKEILYKTIQKMQERFDSKPQDIIAGIAPSIGRCCYEVGADVAKHFFEDMDAMDRVGEKYMLDLPYINQQQLLKAGLKAENIELSGICTACDVEHYFSYRQEQGCSGRFMSIIGLKGKSK